MIRTHEQRATFPPFLPFRVHPLPGRGAAGARGGGGGRVRGVREPRTPVPDRAGAPADHRGRAGGHPFGIPAGVAEQPGGRVADLGSPAGPGRGPDRAGPHAAGGVRAGGQGRTALPAVHPRVRPLVPPVRRPGGRGAPARVPDRAKRERQDPLSRRIAAGNRAGGRLTWTYGTW